MPPKTKQMHSWERTGFDPDTNRANIYTCRKPGCGMVKATREITTPQGYPGWNVEYSEADGTVIGVNPFRVPRCGGA
jgi:hypothetical protein